MGDLFRESIPDEWIDRVFAVMALCPQHTFQVLTKRAERMRGYLSAARAHPVGLEALGLTLDAYARDVKSTIGTGIILQGDIAHLKVWPLPNVWLGVSCERQEEADERIPFLLQTPAAIRFISAEPLLGPIELRPYLDGHEEAGVDLSRPGSNVGVCIAWTPPLDWVIAGGESGPHARPMHPRWARDIKDDCEAAGVPFFFKQWGNWRLVPAVDGNEEWPAKWPHSFPPKYGDIAHMERVGKKAAGRLLDGIEHNGMPQVCA